MVKLVDWKTHVARPGQILSLRTASYKRAYHYLVVDRSEDRVTMLLREGWPTPFVFVSSELEQDRGIWEEET